MLLSRASTWAQQKALKKLVSCSVKPFFFHMLLTEKSVLKARSKTEHCFGNGLLSGCSVFTRRYLEARKRDPPRVTVN